MNTVIPLLLYEVSEQGCRVLNNQIWLFFKTLVHVKMYFQSKKYVAGEEEEEGIFS